MAASVASSVSLSEDEAMLEVALLAEECCVPCLADHEPPSALAPSVGAEGGGAVGGVDGPLAPEGPKTKVHRAACHACGCRLPLTASASSCKCGFTYCAHHMHAHACMHDHKRGHEERLREDNPKIESGRMLERL